MTAINLLFVLVLSGLLAIASAGIGRRLHQLPPAVVQGHQPLRVAEERLFKGDGYPTRTQRVGDADGLSKAKVVMGQVHDEFDKLSAKLPAMAAWDEVVKAPGSLKGVLAEMNKPPPPDDEDWVSQQLRKQLSDPETAFKVTPLPPDFIARQVVPRKADDFSVMVDGKAVDFVWVDKAACWVATEQTPAEPGRVKVEGVAGDVTCQSPTEQQWREAGKLAAIKDLGDKKAEYLRDNKVIGKSFRVQDDEFTKPMDESARKKKTLSKAIIPITPATAEVVRYMGEWKKHNPGKSLAAYNAERQDFMRELSEEKFAYRWVIEPPLPQAP